MNKIGANLANVRKLMHARNLQAYVLPKNDEFMNNNQRPDKDRLRAISDFTGSNGYAIILGSDTGQSHFVTDSRYDL